MQEQSWKRAARRMLNSLAVIKALSWYSNNKVLSFEMAHPGNEMYSIGFWGKALAVTSLASITPPSALGHARHLGNHVTQ